MKKTAQMPSLSTEDTTCVVTSERFAQLIALYRDRAYGLAYRLLSQGPDAEDAVQEALLRAWSARVSFRGDEEGFWAWFLTIVRHVSINMLRRRGLAQQLGITGADEELLLAELPDGHSPPPDEIVLLRESSQNLLAAVNSLPQKLRTVVLLHYGEGLKCQEVADLLGLRLSAVKTRIWRAQGQLRELLSDTRETLTPNS